MSRKTIFIQPKNIAVRFFLCGNFDLISDDLLSEYQRYGDIVLCNLPETYATLYLKVTLRPVA